MSHFLPAISICEQHLRGTSVSMTVSLDNEHNNELCGIQSDWHINELSIQRAFHAGSTEICCPLHRKKKIFKREFSMINIPNILAITKVVSVQHMNNNTLFHLNPARGKALKRQSHKVQQDELMVPDFESSIVFCFHCVILLLFISLFVCGQSGITISTDPITLHIVNSWKLKPFWDEQQYHISIALSKLRQSQNVNATTSNSPMVCWGCLINCAGSVSLMVCSAGEPAN